MHVCNGSTSMMKIFFTTSVTYVHYIYQNFIKMAPFKLLYGRLCRTPLSWDKIKESVLIGTEVIQEIDEYMTMIKVRLKKAQDIQNSYVNVHKSDQSYGIGDKVLIRVKPQKSSIKFGKGENLSRWFVGPFGIIEKGKNNILACIAFVISMHAWCVLCIFLMSLHFQSFAWYWFELFASHREGDGERWANYHIGPTHSIDRVLIGGPSEGMVG